MRLRVLQSFKDKLNEQLAYIAQDKPGAARKFKSEVMLRIRSIPQMPYANRKSIFFDRDDIRDLVVRGYIVVYKVNPEQDTIDVFGFTKYEDNPFR